jgi:hypothetical protein
MNKLDEFKRKSQSIQVLLDEEQLNFFSDFMDFMIKWNDRVRLTSITEETEVIRPNVKRGKKQTVNLDLIPYAWVRMNIRKTGAYDYMSINSLPGAQRGNQVYSDTVVVSRALGNQEIQINTFKYLNFQPTNQSYFIQTIGQDTVDISIDF